MLRKPYNIVKTFNVWLQNDDVMSKSRITDKNFETYFSNRFDVSAITDKSRVITERTSNLVLSVMMSDLSVIVRNGKSITG